MKTYLPEIQTLAEYEVAYASAANDPDAFWAQVANSFDWYKPWDTVRKGGFDAVDYTWFEGAELNITTNCIDRHLPQFSDKTAIIWEPNDPARTPRRITYADLAHEVNRLAGALQVLGVQPGDRVCIYMPMVPEAVFAMLACARIGAVHSVVFGGFSAASLASRIEDCGCTWLLTADGGYRGTKFVPLKSIVDEALASQPHGIRQVVVLEHTREPIDWSEGRDLSWQDLLNKVHPGAFCEPVRRKAEDPLFILYTSGSTGKPKGIVHTTAGYMVGTAYTFRNVFQLKSDDVYCCTADVGWITGHSYLVYGPLLNAATIVLFEGIPTYPTPARFWELVDKHQITIFYTAPTAIRALEALGTQWPESCSLTSLRVLGTVGEPINQEAWQWYHRHIGKERCPIVDTWWQTETGMMMITTLAGLQPTRPTYAGKPLPGVLPVLMDEQGQPLAPADHTQHGRLCLAQPWPSMARTTWGDHQRFVQTYFSTFKGYYFTGDGALLEPDGYIRITGRVDDVINVSGHRIGTAEVEDALNEHPHVVESAVVGYPHDIKGQAIYAFVVLAGQDTVQEDTLKAELNNQVVRLIGALARPEKIQIVPGLPKTRSGKIMRRILRKLAEGEGDHLGDTSTLLDPGIVDEIKKGLR